MAGQRGVLETQDLIKLGFIFAMKLIERTRDGFQLLPDTIALILDENLRDQYAIAANGARESIEEIKELDVEDIAALFGSTIEQVRMFISFLRGDLTDQELQKQLQDEADKRREAKKAQAAG